MASNLLPTVNVSISNCDSEAGEKGTIGVQFDNFVLNEELKNTQSLLLKDLKRPSLAIYRPGMGLLHKHGQKTNDSDEERAPDGEENHDELIWSSTLNTGSPDLSISDSKALLKDSNNLKTFKKKNDHGHKMNKEPLSSSQKQSRNKRPDQPKYIPKPKIAAQSPSPDPSEAGLDPCFLSLSRIRSPVQMDKNCCTEKLGNLEKNQALEHEFQNQKSDHILAATQRDQNKSTNFTGSVIKPKQNKIDANNYKTTRQSNSNPSQNWQNSDSKMNINNSRPNSSLSNKSYNQNSSRDGKSGRRFKKDRDTKREENSSYQRGRFSRNSRKEETNLNNVDFTTVNESVAKHLVSENYKNEEIVSPPIKSNSSSPSRDNSINIKREESPKPISNAVFNSPKGRGRGRSQTILANATENRPLLSEIIITGRESSSGSLPIFDYEAQGPRPTLVFESSRKITDWNQEVTDEENTINAAKGLSDNGESGGHSIGKRLNCLANDNKPKLPENHIDKVQSKKDKPISDFQQNLPPRFHRSKDNLPTNESNLRNDSSTNEKGIIKVNWKNIGIESRESPVNSSNGSNLSKRYQALEPVHYKTLYDPAHPAINHHTLHSNTVLSYPQPNVPRSAMPGNGFPLSAPPIVKNCRIPSYRERDHYPTQSHPNLPRNVNKPLGATYSPYMMYGPVQSNSQVPPPQNGMFPQPYSETAIPPQDKRVKPIVEKNLCDIASLERELNTYLSKGLDIVDQKTLGRCRWKIQLRYENIILADPRFCADKNVENALWKSTFHQVIEAYRKLKELHPSRQEEYNKAIINLVEEGTVFYESLLEKQQETFGINFTPYLDNDSVTKPNPLDSVKLILISTQKLFICLGDLARYREQATNTSNYGKARSWYIKAQQIAPKNGRPYNQLAILAISARRKLDAVYYYMRSLAASNPFLSARESLLGLFDEARKKYEVVEKKKLEEKGVREKSDKSKKGWKNRNNDRLEVWIHPSGIQHSKTSIPDNNENSQSEISTVELNKRFVLSFLHVHGKLFTKVGMENFTETANQMLQEFKNLLQCSPAPLASVRLLQLLAINMFSVANTSAKGGPPMNSSERPLLQEQALQVSLAMMAIGIERSTILLKEHLSSPDYPTHLVSYDLAQLLPTVKVFTDWMSCQRNLWSPPPTLGDLRTGCKGDIWTLYANLLNELKKMKGCGIELKNTKLEGYDLVILPEDISLACFVPLLGAPQNPYYGQPPLDKERARTWLRIIRILFFGDYLCGISPPYLKFDVQTTSYVSLITSHSEENTESSSPNTTYNSSDEDETIEDLPEDCDEDVTNDTSDIGKLWHRQEALKKKKDREDRRKAQIQQVLRDHRTKRAIELQVTPKYLIPDTNCFIDHLVKIDLLLKSKTYNLVVPLIVINELDGLARGERPNSSSGFHQRPSSPLYRNSHVSPHDQQRARQVGQAAKDAVSFLEDFFSTRDYRLKAITSKGNILDSISIRSEDIGDKKGTNDDLILSCCLHYCKNDKPSEYMPKDSDGPIHITREIVLLTDDRNLRVKAMTHNVPTRSLDEFLRWANIR